VALVRALEKFDLVRSLAGTAGLAGAKGRARMAVAAGWHQEVLEAAIHHSHMTAKAVPEVPRLVPTRGQGTQRQSQETRVGILKLSRARVVAMTLQQGR
jgi:hypothetical protein